MNLHIALTYYTSEELINSFEKNYKKIKDKIGLAGIARIVNDYNIVENLRVEKAKEFFQDSELLFMFWGTERGRKFLNTPEGHVYLKTDEGKKYINRYGFKVNTNYGSDIFSKFPKLIVEKQSDYQDFQKLWIQ